MLLVVVNALEADKKPDHIHKTKNFKGQTSVILLQSWYLLNSGSCLSEPPPPRVLLRLMYEIIVPFRGSTAASATKQGVSSLEPRMLVLRD